MVISAHEISLETSSYEILNPEKLNSAQEVIDLLGKVETPFLQELERIAREKNPGWGFQKVTQGPNGVTMKQSAWAMEQGAEFTAENWCTTSSVVLYRNLVEKLGPNVQIKFIALMAPTFGENWDRPGYKAGKFVGHNILEISDGDKDVYVDPTYGQIDSRWKGQFAYIDHRDLGIYYGSENVTVTPLDATQLMNWYITSALKNGTSGVRYVDLKGLGQLIDEKYQETVNNKVQQPPTEKQDYLQ
jgi:hypothetical protein